jgi:hypothetical protein
MIGKMVEPAEKFLKYNFSITNSFLLAPMNVLMTFKSDNTSLILLSQRIHSHKYSISSAGYVLALSQIQ